MDAAAKRGRAEVRRTEPSATREARARGPGLAPRAAAGIDARRGERGFTLLELLVTTTVVLIGFAGLLALHVAVLGGNASAARSAEAVAVAERTIEQLRSETVSGMVQDLTGSATTALPVVGVSLPTATGRNGVTYARKATVEELTAASPDLIRIHVDVSWTDDGAVAGAGHDHRVSLELVRTRQEGL